MQIARQRRPSVKIEMSPLIDCVFLLLIFFMLSSTFLTPSIQLTLPQASLNEPAQNQQLLVTIDRQGQIYVNTEQVAIGRLSERLGPLIAASDDKVVTIRGDEKMPYEYFVRALDAAKSSGAVHVNIAHEFMDE